MIILIYDFFSCFCTIINIYSLICGVNSKQEVLRFTRKELLVGVSGNLKAMSATVVVKLIFFLMIIQSIVSAPTKSDPDRTKKSISYTYDYINQNEDEQNFDDGLYSYYEENDISRSIPTRKKIKNSFDSPIYYIKLPPQPYMFVPGYGYMSQPPHQPNHHRHINDFLNVPVQFLSNGKPSNIYQWNSALDYENDIPNVHDKESNIRRVPGEFVFNGKPNDIYVLRDSYNSLYSDTLQNFYP